jgi:hypothetical protein
MKASHFAAIILAGFAINCASLLHFDFYEIREHYDPFTQTRTLEMYDNGTCEERYRGGSRVALGFKRIVTSRLDTTFTIELRYREDSWLFIDHLQPLTLLLDGQKISLIAISKPTREADGYGITERVSYMADRQLLKKIAFGKSCIGRIVGDEFYQDFTFGSWNFERMREFVRAYVDSAVPIN